MRNSALTLTAILLAVGASGATITETPSLIQVGATDGAKRGPNGGKTTVANGHPIEFVESHKELVFFVIDDDGKPLDTKGLSARAVVQADGKTQTVALGSAAPNKLVGSLPAPLATGAKVVLSTRIHNHSVQARFEK